MSYEWTDERKQRLRDLWLAGSTATAIMNALSCTSRAAVCGKLQRMGLLRTRPKPAPKKAKIQKSSSRPISLGVARGRPDQGIVLQQRLARFTEQPIPLVVRKGCFEATDKPGISFDDLHGLSCRWPLGLHPFAYCGDPKPSFGVPYCPSHMALAYTPETKAEKRENRKASVERRSAEIVRAA